MTDSLDDVARLINSGVRYRGRPNLLAYPIVRKLREEQA